jgi:hypothetical protein
MFGMSAGGTLRHADDGSALAGGIRRTRLRGSPYARRDTVSLGRRRPRLGTVRGWRPLRCSQLASFAEAQTQDRTRFHAGFARSRC